MAAVSAEFEHFIYSGYTWEWDAEDEADQFVVDEIELEEIIDKYGGSDDDADNIELEVERTPR